MLQSFVYSSLPVRVFFGMKVGEGLRQEINRLRLQRVMVISTRGRRGLGQFIADKLGPQCLGGRSQ